MTRPVPGEIWEWIPGPDGAAEHYGAGTVLGIREGYDMNETLFVSFMFAHHGVFNVPLPMVQKHMRRSKNCEKPD